jgi:hypothetical protein
MPSKAMASPSTVKYTGRILTAPIKVRLPHQLAFRADADSDYSRQISRRSAANI